MKLCPKCKAALDDNARFCLCCMTSLDEKEQIPPPVLRTRRWSLVLLCGLLFAALLLFILIGRTPPSDKVQTTSTQDTVSEPPAPPSTHSAEVPLALTQEVDGVRYTFRPATGEDHPTAVAGADHYVLIGVSGVPVDGIYRVPTFVGDDMKALVTVIADGAFAGTNARSIDLGYNVRYVWGNAFGGYPLTDLYLHEDVWIEPAAFSGCTKDLTIHCPEYLENTQGVLWSDLSVSYGFRWQQEAL